ncbi:transposase [Ancylobacter polymorphus]|uniref:Transposase n=1 Tax=Ancylobacter polymorphus TaxID=223390 RepID=A0A9E7D7Z5_9HYPH|nr:transposase [Ancylobacter polymorphus]UOK71469.1 transposase [Ancylobacter polymorphus]UOK71474.1 transposase [Ancylobacter polymorphus]UOK72816.1 transposase [Ancylobacter polymorphus]
MDAEETYVRRRRWSWAEKRAVVEEAAASGNVIETAKRHGIQAQQIYRWRERLSERMEPAGFAAVSVIDPPKALPAPMPGMDRLEGCSTSSTAHTDTRIEIASAGGVTVSLPVGSSAEFVVAIAGGLSRGRR